jgi:pimeloyl-ACP methyl ester carboxylesterase
MYMAGLTDDEVTFDAMVREMTVDGYLDKITCPTLLATGEFDPLCPLEDAVRAFSDLTSNKEMWVIENQFHPLWNIPNLGGLDCHHYIIDWLQRALVNGKTNKTRIAYVKDNGDGPFGRCEWTPPIKPDEAYF